MKEAKIVLGTWAWGSGMYGGDSVFGHTTNEETLKNVFNTALKEDLNIWDTAPAYAMGDSERILGSYIANHNRENIIVSTKFTPPLAELYDFSIEKMATASMERLHINHIDMYWIHTPMDVERWTPAVLPLLKSGKVKSVGVSNHNLSQLKRVNEILQAEGFKVSAVQNHYSLLYRSSEKAGILDFCKENNIQFWAYMVLEQGALSGKYNTQDPLPEESDRGKNIIPC